MSVWFCASLVYSLIQFHRAQSALLLTAAKGISEATMSVVSGASMCLCFWVVECSVTRESEPLKSVSSLTVVHVCHQLNAMWEPQVADSSCFHLEQSALTFHLLAGMMEDCFLAWGSVVQSLYLRSLRPCWFLVYLSQFPGFTKLDI